VDRQTDILITVLVYMPPGGEATNVLLFPFNCHFSRDYTVGICYESGGKDLWIHNSAADIPNS